MTINDFEELEIWREARELAKTVRVITNQEPFKKDFRFRSQFTSASGSIMDNIAEGFDRDGNKEFVQFLYIAKGSNAEVRSQSYRAYDANFISKDSLDDLLNKTGLLKKKLNNLIKYLRNSENKGFKYSKPKT